METWRRREKLENQVKPTSSISSTSLLPWLAALSFNSDLSSGKMLFLWACLANLTISHRFMGTAINLSSRRGRGRERRNHNRCVAYWNSFITSPPPPVLRADTAENYPIKHHVRFNWRVIRKPWLSGYAETDEGDRFHNVFGALIYRRCILTVQFPTADKKKKLNAKTFLSFLTWLRQQHMK